MYFEFVAVVVDAEVVSLVIPVIAVVDADVVVVVVNVVV